MGFAQFLTPQRIPIVPAVYWLERSLALIGEIRPRAYTLEFSETLEIGGCQEKNFPGTTLAQHMLMMDLEKSADVVDIEVSLCLDSLCGAATSPRDSKEWNAHSEAVQLIECLNAFPFSSFTFDSWHEEECSSDLPLPRSCTNINLGGRLVAWNSLEVARCFKGLILVCGGRIQRASIGLRGA